MSLLFPNAWSPPRIVVWILAAVAATVAAAGCGRDEALDATTELPALGVEFDHPVGLSLQSQTDDEIQFCFSPPADVRSPRCLTLRQRQGGELSVTRRHQTAIAGEGQLYYDLVTTEGGSGGAEHRLDGYVSLALDGSEGVNVSATASGGDGFDDASWALPVIESMRLIP